MAVRDNSRKVLSWGQGSCLPTLCVLIGLSQTDYTKSDISRHNQVSLTQGESLCKTPEEVSKEQENHATVSFTRIVHFLRITMENISIDYVDAGDAESISRLTGARPTLILLFFVCFNYVLVQQKMTDQKKKKSILICSRS